MQKVERYKAEPRKSPISRTTKFSEEEIALANALIETINKADNLEALREIWVNNPTILEVPIGDTTPKDVLNKRAKEFS
jgi:hypothetical protein